MNISLPNELKDYVDTRIQTDAYGSSSEYVRDLIRQDRDRQQLRNYILKGIQSPVVGDFDEAYLLKLKQRVLDVRAKTA